jgi:hypothetical protein
LNSNQGLFWDRRFGGEEREARGMHAAGCGGGAAFGKFGIRGAGRWRWCCSWQLVILAKVLNELWRVGWKNYKILI